MNKKHKLIIVGNSAFAQIAYEYFTHDSPYEVVAFSVEKAFLKDSTLLGLPVITFEDLKNHYDPSQHSVFVAAAYTQLNRLRTRLASEAKAKGFALASYISSRAFVWRNVQMGEHCFIFEHNVVQPFVVLKDNIILWSGNHIGHHSVIGSNCFISSHVVVSGYCTLGNNCFFGVNSTLSNNITVGHDVVLGAGALLLKDAEGGKVYAGNPARPSQSSSLAMFKV